MAKTGNPLKMLKKLGSGGGGGGGGGGVGGGVQKELGTVG